MLHGVSSKLSRLLEVDEIGVTIADELRQLIDYHNCRVFLREGDDLRPVAFRGDLTETSGSAFDALATRVGVGVTGHVAATGEPFLTGDAANCGIGHHIDGTARIEESLLAVPLRYGPSVIGVLVISKLGLDQFDADDLRLLEVLAGHASVALVNARLYEAQRREAEGAKALLELSRELAAVTELDGVVERVARGRRSDPRCAAGIRLASSERRRRARVPQCVAPRPGRERPARRPPAVVGPGAVVATLRAVRDRPERLRAPARRRLLPHRCRRLRRGADRPRRGLCLALARDSTARRISTTGSSISSRGSRPRRSSRSRMPSPSQSLERTFLSTVEALANALEAKDEYTSSHARWIRDMAVRVGEELGLDAVVLKRLELGALFHDIGKIGIPAAILGKPGPLTAEERELIETHTAARRADPRPDRAAGGRPADRPRLPRTLRRQGIPGPPRGRRDPARGADHLRLRRVPRDDDVAALP